MLKITLLAAVLVSGTAQAAPTEMAEIDRVCTVQKDLAMGLLKARRAGKPLRDFVRSMKSIKIQAGTVAAVIVKLTYQTPSKLSIAEWGDQIYESCFNIHVKLALEAK